MGIQSEYFDTFHDPQSGEDSPVSCYTLRTSKGVIVKIISFGATVISTEVPDKTNKSDHVVLGYDSLQDYVKYDYFGSTIGRFAGRIKEGKFNVNGKDYQLSINNNNNHLHGGKQGWDKCVWKSFVHDNKVTFSHFSRDGDEGYPGDVFAQVTYSLDEDGSFKIDFQAISSEATPINLTNHNFFNLAGHAAGQKGLYEHEFEVLGDSYLPLDSNLIPTGEIESVNKTPFDMRKPKPVSALLAKAPSTGFDHTLLSKNKRRQALELAAIFTHPPSGRKMELYTSEPAIQVYTCNLMPKEEGEIVGRGGASYTYQGAFCCEPQNFPDAVNRPSFPNAILKPGQVYRHTLVYKYTTG